VVADCLLEHPAPRRSTPTSTAAANAFARAVRANSFTIPFTHVGQRQQVEPLAHSDLCLYGARVHVPFLTSYMFRSLAVRPL
jgi:hypothetical protein